MITLYQFPSLWGLPNPSPLCMKLESYLRMAKLPYRICTAVRAMEAPKKKLPFIQDDSYIISDSHLIIKYLKEKYGDPLDENLSKDQQCQSILLQRLLEDHLYWTALYFRWQDPQGWEITREGFFKKPPQLTRKYIANKIRKYFLNELFMQGMGRHSNTEVAMLGIEDIQALSQALGQQSYFLGDNPHSIDACAHAFLSNLHKPPIENPLKEYLLKQRNLMQYCERMDTYLYQ